MAERDAIVVGGGVGGLTTAALLAGRGWQVTLCERRDRLGGLAAGEEFWPGYRSAGILHDTGTLRRAVADELRLGAHGLRWTEPAAILAPERDGPGLLLESDPDRTATEIARRAPRDADGYRAFRTFIDRMRPFLCRLLDSPAPDIGARGLGMVRQLLPRGLELRRLGREAMAEALRVAPMCAGDWLGEHFENELTRAALAHPALLASWTGPWSAGTAALLWIHESTTGAEVAGGAPQLVEALIAACRAGGVTLLTGAAVERITLRGDAVAGVLLEDGRALSAGVVVSALDPLRTFAGLLRPIDLPAGLFDEIRCWRARGTTAVLQLALAGPLEFRSRPGEAIAAARIADSLDDMERAFDAVKYRAMSEHPILDVRVPTVADPSLAPSGHHVASILVHFAPHDLDGGWTGDARDQLLRRTLDRLQAHAPGVRDATVGHRLLTPPDLEREYGLTGGHLHHGEQGLDQMLWLRPSASCARHRTPIPGLYLCGAGTHPGGGLSAAPAALAAAAIGRP